MNARQQAHVISQNVVWLVKIDAKVEKNLTEGPLLRPVTWGFMLRTVQYTSAAHLKLRGFPL